MNNEIWKDIIGYEGFYKISNYGKVKSLARLVKMGPNKFRQTNEMFLNPSKSIHGYWRLCLQKNGKRNMHFIHRLIGKAFIPNPENKPEINHINGIRDDNSMDNLEWVTTLENQLHSVHVLKRKILRGNEVGNSILNPELILELKYMKQYFSYTKLQDIYEIDRATIHLAVTGKNWKHLMKDEYDA